MKAFVKVLKDFFSFVRENLSFFIVGLIAFGILVLVVCSIFLPMKEEKAKCYDIVFTVEDKEFFYENVTALSFRNRVLSFKNNEGIEYTFYFGNNYLFYKTEVKAGRLYK